MKKICVILYLLSTATQLSAQNLDKLNKEEALKVSGGVQFNAIAYAQNGLPFPSREPFTWYSSGNLNVNLLDVALPFTYAYSNQGGKFTQPFNRAAFHPQYKWAKAHIGIVSMNFSPYTLSGHLFAGAGIELTPGKWKIQAMAGRLNKAVDYDAVEDNLNEIAFQRFGYGIKTAYESKGYGGAITFFKAQDDPNSINYTPLNSAVDPQDNLVIAIEGKAKILQNLNITAEYALSGLTQNLNAVNDLEGEQKSVIHPIINGNSTTAFFQAYKTALNYSLKTMKISFNYEHIDPGYKTLGGYYFNNDLENYTIAPSFTLFKKKLNIGLNTGYQVNNLSAEKSATTNRWVGNLNATYVPSNKLIFSGTYSNFSSFTKNRPTTDPFYFTGADTLNFYQLTQNASGMVNYSFGDAAVKNNCQLLYNYQESTSLVGNLENGGAFGTSIGQLPEGVPAKTHLVNLAYTRSMSKSGFAITAAGNINKTDVGEFNTLFIGPTLNLQKKILAKKGNLSLGSTYNRQFTAGLLNSNILNHRLAFTFTPKKDNEKIGQASFSANANLMQRFAIEATQTNVTELNVFVNFGYSF